METRVSPNVSDNGKRRRKQEEQRSDLRGGGGGGKLCIHPTPHSPKH